MSVEDKTINEMNLFLYHKCIGLIISLIISLSQDVHLVMSILKQMREKRQDEK